MQSFNGLIKHTAITNCVINILLNLALAYFLNISKEFIPLGGLLVADMAITGFLLAIIIFPIVVLTLSKKVRENKVQVISITELDFYSLARIFYAIPQKFSKNIWIASLSASVFGIFVGIIFYALTYFCMYLLGCSAFSLIAFAIYKGIFTGILAAKITYFAAPYILSNK